MNSDDRIQVQKEFVARVCDVIMPLEPAGVLLKFIDKRTDYGRLKTTKEVIDVLDSMPYTGGSGFGMALEKYILEPLVFQKIRENDFKKPLLVIVLTDGGVRVLIKS